MNSAVDNEYIFEIIKGSREDFIKKLNKLTKCGWVRAGEINITHDGYTYHILLKNPK